MRYLNLLTRKLKPAELQNRRAMKRVFNNTLRKTIKALDRTDFNIEKDDINDEEYIEKQITPAFIIYAKIGFETAVSFYSLGQGLVKQAVDENLYLKLARRKARLAAKTIDTTSIKQLRRIIRSKSVRKVVNRKARRQLIIKKFKRAMEVRNQVIVRTESMAVANISAQISYKRAGYEYNEWQAIIDSKNEGDICRDLHGEIAKIGKTFLSLYTAPPAHPNCRCVLIPVRTKKK